MYMHSKHHFICILSLSVIIPILYRIMYKICNPYNNNLENIKNKLNYYKKMYIYIYI